MIWNYLSTHKVDVRFFELLEIKCNHSPGSGLMIYLLPETGQQVYLLHDYIAKLSFYDFCRAGCAIGISVGHDIYSVGETGSGDCAGNRLCFLATLQIVEFCRYYVGTKRDSVGCPVEADVLTCTADFIDRAYTVECEFVGADESAVLMEAVNQELIACLRHLGNQER